MATELQVAPETGRSIFTDQTNGNTADTKPNTFLNQIQGIAKIAWTEKWMMLINVLMIVVAWIIYQYINPFMNNVSQQHIQKLETGHERVNESIDAAAKMLQPSLPVC